LRFWGWCGVVGYLSDLGKSHKDIKIALVNWVDDKVFPMKMVQKRSTEYWKLWKIIDWFYSIKWWHNEIYQNIEFIEALNAILENLNKKNITFS